MRCDHCVPKKIKGIYHMNGLKSEILCLHENALTIRNLANLFETHGRITCIATEMNKNNEPVGASRIKFATEAEANNAMKAITSLLNKTSKSKRDVDVVIEECFSLAPGANPVFISQQTYTKLSTERAVSMKTLHRSFAKGQHIPISRQTSETKPTSKLPAKQLNKTFDVVSKETVKHTVRKQKKAEGKGNEKTAIKKTLKDENANQIVVVEEGKEKSNAVSARNYMANIKAMVKSDVKRTLNRCPGIKIK